MPRKYSVEEIDRMRGAVDVLQWNRARDFQSPSDQIRRVEEHLRTYMLAGITPDALVEFVKRQTNMDPDGFTPK